MTEHKTLHEALCAVQAEAETLPKDGVNPHFKSKFTPLDTIVERVGPLLAKHGLTWSTFPCFGPDNQPALRYKLTHAASGGSESEVMPLLLVKADPQGLGAGVTYARRYSLTAVLNLVADEDDDGASANGKAKTATAAEPTLSDEGLAIVLDAIGRAKMGTEWVRSQLVAVGAQHVPSGEIMKGTIRRLTPEQAVEMVKACDAAAESKAAKA